MCKKGGLVSHDEIEFELQNLTVVRTTVNLCLRCSRYTLTLRLCCSLLNVVANQYYWLSQSLLQSIGNRSWSLN